MRPARLRLLLAALFLGLAVPSVVLIRQGFGQLELETFRQQQLLAESAARRVDAGLAGWLAREEARPFEDFSFASLIDGVQARSPLSRMPVGGGLPGTLGHFQIDADGTLTTPILPVADAAAAGLDGADLAARTAVRDVLLGVLAENRLVGGRGTGSAAAREEMPAAREAEAPGAERRARASAPAADVPDEELRGQAAFDRLRASDSRDEALRSGAAVVTSFADNGSGRLSPGTLDERAAPRPGAAPAVAGVRDAVEAAKSPRQLGAAEPATAAGAGAAEQAQALAEADAAATEAPARRIATFAGELEPFQFSRLDTGHFVLYRNAWRGGERFVQGALIDQQRFIATAVRAVVEGSGLAPGTRLTVSDGATVLAELETPTAPGAAETARRDAQTLLSTRLSPPFSALELGFDAGRLPRGPAYRALVWTAIALFGVLIAGLYAVYHFGLRQIELARTQQNFVSAVSHELKTPLTSIRMYGEMLKSGWAGEDKKQSYYDFIYAEGERLSRLIDNVLMLARLDRNGPVVEPVPMTVASLLDLVESKTATQLELAGLTLQRECEETVAGLEVMADADAVAQVFINLVDNAIKFAGPASSRLLLRARPGGRGLVELCLRDFGPGIPPAAMKRLFELFYRPDNELTRGAAGTGIGLALVRQLAAAMGGRVDVRNADPGAEFRLLLPLADSQ